MTTDAMSNLLKHITSLRILANLTVDQGNKADLLRQYLQLNNRNLDVGYCKA